MEYRESGEAPSLEELVATQLGLISTRKLRLHAELLQKVDYCRDNLFRDFCASHCTGRWVRYPEARIFTEPASAFTYITNDDDMPIPIYSIFQRTNVGYIVRHTNCNIIRNKTTPYRWEPMEYIYRDGEPEERDLFIDEWGRQRFNP